MNDDNTEGQLADMMERLVALENKETPQNHEQVQETRTYFPEPKEIYNHSITATETTWSDSTSGLYIPRTAKRAIIFAYVDGTSDATGLNKVEAKAAGIQRPILILNEEGTLSGPSACIECEVVVSEGRFDVLATIGSGRTSGSFDFVILLLGYVN